MRAFDGRYQRHALMVYSAATRRSVDNSPGPRSARALVASDPQAAQELVTALRVAKRSLVLAACLLNPGDEDAIGNLA